MPRPSDVSVGVAILVVSGNNYNLRLEPASRVLLIKRLGAHCGNVWAGVGGWIDLIDQTPLDACKRELEEEIGIRNTVDDDFDLLTVTSEYHEDLKVRTVTIYYRLWYAEKEHGIPQIREKDKCSDIRWFKKDELPKELFPKLELGLKEIGF